MSLSGPAIKSYGVVNIGAEYYLLSLVSWWFLSELRSSIALKPKFSKWEKIYRGSVN